MEQRQNHPSFSLHEFKNWISQQDDLSNFFDLGARLEDDTPNAIIGSQVHAKVGRKKLLERIEEEDGNPRTLVEDLVDGGGVILGISGKNVIVEVQSGRFQIPRFCVRLDSED